MSRLLLVLRRPDPKVTPDPAFRERLEQRLATDWSSSSSRWAVLTTDDVTPRRFLSVSARTGLAAMLATLLLVGLPALLWTEGGHHGPGEPPTDLEMLPIGNGTWEQLEFDFTGRSGSAALIGQDWLFVWSGLPDRSGAIEESGILVSLTTGEVRPLPNAPISPRMGAVVVWTGDEFVVFGGADFHSSFVDGAAYRPASDTWRTIKTAPMFATKTPTATWTGTEMLVWLPGNPSQFGTIPEASVGQMAAYDPVEDRWREFPDPPLSVSDATLLRFENTVLLVGGPSMRDLGSIGLPSPLQVAALDLRSFSWNLWAPNGPTAEAARAFQTPGGDLAVLTDNSLIYVVRETGWFQVGQLPDECPWQIAGTSHGRAYIHSCDLFEVTEAGIVPLPFDQGEYLSPGAADALFLADRFGRLAVLIDAANQELPSGESRLMIYDPTVAEPDR